MRRRRQLFYADLCARPILERMHGGVLNIFALNGVKMAQVKDHGPFFKLEYMAS